MSIEIKYQDVLQNLEAIVSAFYRENAKITDFQVQSVYEAVTERYRADERGSEPRDFNLSELQNDLIIQLEAVAEVLLGRTKFETPDQETIDHAILIRCLRKLQRSVPKWTKRGGSQGYLNFVSQFV